LNDASERALIERLRVLRPQVVLVGMGNPKQVEFICRHLDDPGLGGTLWLAVGGQFDYYGGTLRRAPSWLRKVRLEWLYIVAQQPHKLHRYFVGIPLYLSRCALATLLHSHDLPNGEPS
jgi:N-acetylglucosaminyldiphosphoundecaprenol N-acetyl-beta-D-mannosaminyltransferase